MPSRKVTQDFSRQKQRKKKKKKKRALAVFLEQLPPEAQVRSPKDGNPGRRGTRQEPGFASWLGRMILAGERAPALAQGSKVPQSTVVPLNSVNPAVPPTLPHPGQFCFSGSVHVLQNAAEA